MKRRSEIVRRHARRVARLEARKRATRPWRLDHSLAGRLLARRPDGSALTFDPLASMLGRLSSRLGLYETGET